ncbi:MAG TPA: hypothetical protein VEZ14_08545 [Dehalococcoidia bacterium]|nr:hypothetical protein [Dehalococcoidia bacterium]
MLRIRSSPLFVTACVLGALLLGACSRSGTSPKSPQPAVASAAARATPDLWHDLRTPLRLARLAPGSSCPATAAHAIAPWVGPAQGVGPAYPVGLSAPVSLRGAPAQDGRYAIKTLWVSDAVYTGPVLVRGLRLDAAGAVQFALGSTPHVELRLPLDGSATTEGQDPGWRAWPAQTLVPGPGCYGLQIDGAGFSSIVVFSVAP